MEMEMETFLDGDGRGERQNSEGITTFVKSCQCWSTQYICNDVC